VGIKYRINEEFFDKWSCKMAYILGYLYADGSMINAEYMRGKYIRATSIDKELIMRVKESMDSEHKIKVIKPSSINRKTKYFLQVGSHKVFDSLDDLGLHPNKSLNVRFPKVPEQFLPDFVRGYFDGDGSVAIERRDGSIKRLRTTFTSGSRSFLSSLSRKLIETADICNSTIYNSHRSFQLCYSTRDSFKLFNFMYRGRPRLFLKRKFNIFNKFIKSRRS
jgi:hypothetical protein